MAYLIGSAEDHYNDVQARLADAESYAETKVANQPTVIAWQTIRDKLYGLHDALYASWLDYDANCGDATTHAMVTNSGGRSKPKKAP